jgi:hypothetical protein
MSSSLITPGLRASRFVRLLAAFAWAMLVVVSLPANAMGTIGDTADGGVSALTCSMMDHGMTHPTPAGAQHQGHCCGGPAHPACHCDAAGGGVLLPALPTWSRTALLADSYGRFHGSVAPALPPWPPLRPPTA